jgi:hypothetical protein
MSERPRVLDFIRGPPGSTLNQVSEVTDLYRIYASAVLRQTQRAGRIFLGIYGHRYSPHPRQEAPDCGVVRIYHCH